MVYFNYFGVVVDKLEIGAWSSIVPRCRDVKVFLVSQSIVVLRLDFFMCFCINNTYFNVI